MTELMERIQQLFEQARACEATHDIKSARKIESLVARLVDAFEKTNPRLGDLADALAKHEYVLLSLSRTTRRADMRKQLRNRAYAKGATAVELRLKGKHDLGTAFACYNLAIDLIVSEKRPAEGLMYMLKARRIMRRLPESESPRGEKFFWMDYGIGKAYFDLGEVKKAHRFLVRSLRNHNLGTFKDPRDFSELNGMAKAAELLWSLHNEILRVNRVHKPQASS